VRLIRAWSVALPPAGRRHGEEDMYEEYWGLAVPPSQNVPDPTFFFLSAQHREGLTRLLYAVKHNKGAALLVGDGGCGKTTLSRAFLLELAEEKYDIGLVSRSCACPAGRVTAMAAHRDAATDGRDGHRSLE
jgi:type II secretory pathway predicted ATPase ExeA